MLAVKYLVKLYDLPGRYGTVTAFDTYANALFVGTSHGTLLKLIVEGLPEYPAAGHDTAQTCESNSEAASTAGMPSSAPIFTSVVAQATVATGGDGGPVSQLQHSRTRALLFVLCEHRLTVWHSDSLTRLHDLLAPEAPRVSTFFVTHTASRRAGGGCATDSRQGLRLIEEEQESSSSHEEHADAAAATPQRGLPSPDSAPPSPLPPAAAAAASDAVHVIYAAEYMGKGLHVYEYDADAATARGTSARAPLRHDFVLPEPIEAVVAQGDIACVGMRREYSLLSASTGSSRSVLRRGGTGGATALLALGENEVYMRQHRTVFATALQPRGTAAAQTSTSTMLPSSSSSTSAASSMSASMSPAPQQHPPPLLASPSAAAAPTVTAVTTTTMMMTTAAAASPAMGRVLSRTTPLEDEVRLMLVRFPFLFVFTDDYCDVFSVFDAEVTERLPLPGGLFGSQLARGGGLFVAGRRQVWLAGLHALRHQLADLVEQYKIDEAFELLAVQARRRGGRHNESGAELRAMESDLHVMAGFAHLHRCHPSRAMRHFGDHLDPRDLLLHLPACLPPPPCSSFVSAAATRGGGDGTHCDMASVTVCGLDEPVARSMTCEAAADSHTTVPDEEHGHGGWRRGFWRGWCGPNPYNTYVGELARAWRETYETFPRIAATTSATASSSSTSAAAVLVQDIAVPSPAASMSSSTTTPTAFAANDSGAYSQPELRLLPELGPTSLAVFLERGWCALKAALVRYFRDRLARLDSTSTATSYRRAMEYALLVLYLEQRDHRSVYALLARHATALCVEDCYDLLLTLHDYRLLALFLYRHGYVQEAHTLLRSRVYLSSYLPSLSCDSGGGDDDGGTAAGSANVELTMHALRDRVARQVRGWLDTAPSARDSACCSSAMRSLAVLPLGIRNAVATHLLAGAAGSNGEGSAVCTMAGRDEGTQSAAEAWRWWQKMTRHYVEQATQPRRWSRMCFYAKATEPATTRPLVYAMLRCGPIVRMPASAVAAASPQWPAMLPGSLAEAFYLVDKLDLLALRLLLRERPQEADVCDEEGSTLLHACLGLFCLLQRGTRTMSARQTTSKREHKVVGEAPMDDAELVRLLLNVAVLLVNAGTQTCAISLHGCSCLDVLLAALPADGARGYLDLVTAVLLGTVEVNEVCRGGLTLSASDTWR